MFRVLLTVVLPLLLPTAIYAGWIAVTSRSSSRRRLQLGTRSLVWLTLAGVALLAAVLATVSVHFGEPVRGHYVPPRYENGEVIPPHIEPLEPR